MNRLINADSLIENLKNDPVGKLLLVHYNIDGFIKSQPTIDAVPMSELKQTEKERDYWMDMAHSYEQTILRLTISAGEVPVIRCEECKYYPQNSRRWNDPDLIQTYIHCKFMDKNDFCSKALPIVNPKMVAALKKRIEEHLSQIEADPKETDE